MWWCESRRASWRRSRPKCRAPRGPMRNPSAASPFRGSPTCTATPFRGALRDSPNSAGRTRIISGPGGRPCTASRAASRRRMSRRWPRWPSSKCWRAASRAWPSSIICTISRMAGPTTTLPKWPRGSWRPPAPPGSALRFSRCSTPMAGSAALPRLRGSGDSCPRPIFMRAWSKAPNRPPAGCPSVESGSRRTRCGPSRAIKSPPSWPAFRTGRSTSTWPSRSARSRTAWPRPGRDRSNGCSTTLRSVRAGVWFTPPT